MLGAEKVSLLVSLAPQPQQPQEEVIWFIRHQEKHRKSEREREFIFLVGTLPGGHIPHAEVMSSGKSEWI